MKRIFTYLPLYLLLLQCLPARGTWGPALAFPGTDRDGASGFTINGKGYIASGLFSSDTWEYDPATGAWSQKASLNGNQNIIFAASFVINNKAYMVCGDSAFGNSVRAVREYDPVANTWTAKSDFPGGDRVGMLAWVCNGHAFIGGGADLLNSWGAGPCRSDFYEYVPATDSWNSIGTLPTNIAFASCFVIGNDCYFAFGNKTNTLYSNDLWAYNTVAGSWSQKTSCPGSARNMGIGFSMLGEGYAGVGQSFFSMQYTDFYQYDAASDTWTAQNGYPTNMAAGSAAFVINDTAYVGTGADLTTFNFNSNMYRFTPASATSIVGANSESKPGVFPNPAADFIIVSNMENQGRVRICNMEGKVVMDQEEKELSTRFDIRNLGAGLYLCITGNGEKEHTTLFAVTR